jgi:hypothetical protein
MILRDKMENTNVKDVNIVVIIIIIIVMRNVTWVRNDVAYLWI